MPAHKICYAQVVHHDKVVSMEVHMWALVEDEDGSRRVEGLDMHGILRNTFLSDYEGFRMYSADNSTGLEVTR